MIVDTSKIIVFALVAVAAIGVQMYRDNMSQVNLRLNVENGLMIAMIAIILLMLHESISSIVEGMEDMESGSSMPTSTDTSMSSDVNMSSSTDTSMSSDVNMSSSTDTLMSSSSTQQLVNNAVMNTQTLGSPVDMPTNTESTMKSTEAPQAIPMDILNAPAKMGPTGQPSTIPNSDVDRSMNNSSGVMSAEDMSSPDVKVMLESDDPNEDDIQVDVTVNNGMQELQGNVMKNLKKVSGGDDKDPSKKYVLSDPAHWVTENQYKVNVISNCQVCPVTMCDQNFMSV